MNAVYLIILAIGVPAAVAAIVALIEHRRWDRHQEGRNGYLRDRLIMAAPVGFLMPVFAFPAMFETLELGLGMALPVVIGVGAMIGFSLTPWFRNASIRLHRTRYPREPRA